MKSITMHPQVSISQRIREDIVANVLPFGSRLTINMLAERYATSHTPVREALHELSGEGIVVTEPNRGAWVRAIDARFVAELMDLRAGIEARLARLAAERATPAQIATLREIEVRLEAHLADGDHAGALDANREFHGVINAAAASPASADIVSRHWLLLAALWQRYGYEPTRFDGVVNDHQHLIMAIAARDGHAAELIIGAHVMKSKQSLIQRLVDTPMDPAAPSRPGSTLTGR